jgi:hypothetical protein
MIAAFGPGRFALSAASASRKRKVDDVPAELADVS